MSEELHKGDKVQWETSQGTTEGTVRLHCYNYRQSTGCQETDRTD